jgi:hypothetical protein
MTTAPYKRTLRRHPFRQSIVELYQRPIPLRTPSMRPHLRLWRIVLAILLLLLGCLLRFDLLSP